MFTFGFYNSIDHDRVYDATQFGSIFDGVIMDGVFANVGEFLATVSGEGLQVIVKTGRAWFNHTWSLNDAYLPLDLDEPDLLQTRIDAVVLEVDTRVEKRANSIKIVKGIPSVNPVRPTLLNSGGVYQHPLSYVTLKPGATSILPENIELTVGKSDCPFVTAPLTIADVSDLFNEWDGQFNTWFDNLKAQLTDNVVTNLQKQIDEKVNISDRATEEDVKNETEGKWIDAKALADYGRYLSLTPGQTMYSPDANLEEMFPGEFMACDQRIVTDPDLVAELKKFYFRPPNFRHVKDGTVGVTTAILPTQYGMYMNSQTNYGAFSDSISCEYNGDVFFFTGNVGYNILILHTKTNELETINLNTILRDHFSTYYGAMTLFGYIFLFGSNFSIARIKIGTYTSASITSLSPPSKPSSPNAITFRIIPFVDGVRIGYIVCRIDGSSSNYVYVCYTENMFEDVVESSFSMPSTYTTIYNKGTHAPVIEGAFTGQVQKYKSDYYTLLNSGSGYSLLKISVHQTINAEIVLSGIDPVAIFKAKGWLGSLSHLCLNNNFVGSPIGIVDDIFYFYVAPSSHKTGTNAPTPFKGVGAIKIDINTKEVSVAMPDYGAIVSGIADASYNNINSAYTPTNLPNLSGTGNWISLGIFYRDGRPYILWEYASDVSISSFSSSTVSWHSFVLYNHTFMVTDLDFKEWHEQLFFGQPITDEITANKYGNIYDDIITFAINSTATENHYENYYGDDSNIAITYDSEITGGSKRFWVRGSNNTQPTAATIATSNRMLIINRKNPEQYISLLVPLRSIPQQRPIYSNGRLYIFNDSELVYTDLNELVLPYEPGSYIRLPKIQSQEGE